jgi:hypothetical protein
MLIATDRPEGLITALGASGISARAIACFTEDPNDRIIVGNGAKTALRPPGPDELYDALKI